MDDEYNQDFAALGLADVADVEGLEGFLATPLELQRDETVYRSVSTMMLHESINDPVYRSIKVAESCPPSGLGLFEEHQQSFKLQSPLDQPMLGDFSAAGKKQHESQFEISKMFSPLETHIPAPVNAFTTVSDGQLFVRRVELGLRQAEIDFGAFNNASSCISCKTVRDGSAYCFDVYILELQDKCKKKTGANFLVEVQRVSSVSSPSVWASLTKSLMNKLADVCFGDYIDAISTDKASVAVLSDAPRDAYVDFSSPVAALEHSDDAPVVSEDRLAEEFRAMLGCATSGDSPAETRLIMAELIAQLSTQRTNAVVLVKLGALSAVLDELQRLELVHKDQDCMRALCTVVSNLAVHLDGVETDAVVAHELAALIATRIIRAGNSADHVQIELLREAARALTLFSKHLSNRNSLKNQVQLAALTCARSSDLRLKAHGNLVLQNLTIS
ncbi:Hypothetical protein SCF082_LOCUS47614 [Durusdinium trenchii]|uniref:Uncharacterized protein n=1 Tax=Durusdinium trenchii TaxID=1381693 RepID=A0ABP0RRN1_9DINO